MTRNLASFPPQFSLRSFLKAESFSEQWFFSFSASALGHLDFFSSRHWLPKVPKNPNPLSIYCLQPICVFDDPPFNDQVTIMHASNVVLLFLAAFAATPALAAPLSDPTEIRVPSNLETRNPQIGSVVTTRSGDGEAALNEIFAREIPVLKNKREKTGLLPGSLGSRKLGPHQHLQARVSLSTIMEFLRQYRLLRAANTIFRRREITPDQLPVRNTQDDLFTEALKTREIGRQEDIRAGSIPKVPSETVARDDAADDFMTELLQSRDSEITPENLFAFASRAFDDLD